MKSFKGFVLRWMANAAELCPWTRARVAAAARASAEAAVRTCTGGGGAERACGMRWTGGGGYDGSVGLGEEMSVLSALMTLLREDEDGEEVNSVGGGIATLGTGATSQGDPHAGEDSRFGRKPGLLKKIRQGDVIGAWFITCVIVGSMWAMVLWISTNVLEGKDATRGLQ